jgi:hypothetical protein
MFINYYLRDIVVCKGTKLSPSRRVMQVSARTTGSSKVNEQRENAMPVILLWGIPAIIVIGGGTYWLMHLH